MTRRLFAFLLLVAGPGSLAAQTLINKGAHLVVQSGATLYVRGALLNPVGGTINNAGTVRTTGDFTNAGGLFSPGRVVFGGATDQSFTSGGASLGQLEVNNTGGANQNRVLVLDDLIITQDLTLTRGVLRTVGEKLITLPPGGVIHDEGLGRYVQGNLRVVRNNVNGPVDFGNGLALNATGTPLGTVTVTRTAGLAAPGSSFATGPNGSAARSIDRIWSITSTQSPTAAVPLTFSWVADDDNGLANFTAAQVWQQQPADLSWSPTMPLANASARSISTTATTFSRWTVSNSANPLPVELMSFVAERRGNNADLRWSTATEVNNSHFDVENSTDGLHFRYLTRVASRSAANQGAVYTLQDADLARYRAETVYYRLRQVDLDGTETFSPVRAVAAAPAGLLVQAYPNPFGEAVTIRVEAARAGVATLVLRDALGRTVGQQRLVLAPGATTCPLVGVAGLPQGVYLLTISQTGGGQQHLRLTRQ